MEKAGRKIRSVDGYSIYYYEIQLKAGAGGTSETGAGAGAVATFLSTATDLFNATNHLVARVDSMQAVLTNKDSVGETSGIAEKVLVNTPLGDSLRRAMLEVSDRCYAALVSNGRKQALDSILSTVKEYTAPDNWNSQVFHEIPTAAAQTILAALESRCRNAAGLTLKDIDEHLK